MQNKTGKENVKFKFALRYLNDFYFVMSTALRRREAAIIWKTPVIRKYQKRYTSGVPRCLRLGLCQACGDLGWGAGIGR